MVKNPPVMWETWVRSLAQEHPLEEGMATHSNILAWSKRSLVGYSPGSHKESETTERLNTAQHKTNFTINCDYFTETGVLSEVENMQPLL